MKFARIVFLIAGIYGLVVMVPQYFLEGWIGRDTLPPITHPEFYYGFIGVTIAWQVLFLIMSRDPLRFRLMMIPAVLEKAAFLIPVLILLFQRRVAPSMLAPAGIDLVLGILFIVAFLNNRGANNAR
jgi:hypothetical protein